MLYSYTQPTWQQWASKGYSLTDVVRPNLLVNAERNIDRPLFLLCLSVRRWYRAKTAKHNGRSPTKRRASTCVRNFPSAAVSAATFGERPRQAADAAHLLLLAGSQRRCSVDRAGALKVCLRSVEIFDWKD